ncbi:Cytochrome c7 c [uncultured archaeon]|nr:Cytochrome c7 c [uncultured archaeon]
MNKSNIYQCADCHTGSGTPQALQAPKVRTHLPSVTNYSCTDCHSKVVVNAGPTAANVTAHYAIRPTVPTSNYCDYCHGPNATSPFPARNKTIPQFAHDDPGWDGNATCRTCHTNSSVSADPLANDTSSFHELTTEYGDAFNGSVKADCVVCHVQKSPQFVAAPNPPHDISGMAAPDCYGCHGVNVPGTEAQKLHNPTPTTTGGCIACHSNNATRYYVNKSLFALHANVNTTDGMNNVTDADCKTCHHGAADGTMGMKLGAANSSNTYFCQDCHTSAGTGPTHPSDPNLIKDGLSHGKTDCRWCHLAGDSQPRPLSSQLRYHPNGPRGTAAGKNCLSCHVSANLPDPPFHAPGESHVSDLNACQECHSNADNHAVTPLTQNTPPLVSGLSVSTQITSGTPSQVQFTVSDPMLQIAAAQYQVTNSSGIVFDWTNMTGTFNSNSVTINANIDTSGLVGNYTVNVKGMKSAPRTDPSKPYYPLNGQWSSISNAQLNVIQPTGYDNGTVYGTLGTDIAGATVSTNTGVSTIANSSGFYSLSLTNGTYQLTASKDPEYYPNSSVFVTVTAFTTITQNIILTPKPTGNISGTVTSK